MVDQFKDKVMNKFIGEYQKGRTPHPCLSCNHSLKFDSLFRKADELGCEFIATGHHAKIKLINNEYKVEKAKDHGKDQSYVLFTLNQEKLKRLLFPVGHYSKEEIRDIAKKYELSHAEKPDSQDICFIPKGNYRDFLKGKVKPIKGSLIDESGQKLKEHNGIHNFTIGQRKGIEIGGLNKKVYVKEINNKSGDVTISENESLFLIEINFAEIDIFLICLSFNNPGLFISPNQEINELPIFLRLIILFPKIKLLTNIVLGLFRRLIGVSI